MAGYTRQDTANNISNGNVVDADDLDNEFNGVEAAFNAGSGHTHNGSAGEGAPITVIGPAQDIVTSTTLLRPKTTNVVSLGTDALRYKDMYLEGNADIDGTLNIEGAVTLQNTLAVTGNTTVGGTLAVTGNTTVSGNTTLGNADTDTVTFTADVASAIIPSVDDAYDLGAIGSEWRNLYIDGTANIDTASIDTANVVTLAVSGNGTVAGTLTVTGGINATITGSSSTADKLTTARTITLGGDVSGAANFDGSANITITATVADDSHNHVIANVDGLQTALDGKAASVHTHVISDVTGLQTALDGKAASVHTHVISDVTGLQTALDAKVGATYTGDVDITGELVVDSYNETYQAVSSSSGTTTVDCEAGNVFASTLTENTTFVFSNPPASGTAYGFSLRVTASGAYTVTWPASVDWPGGTAPNAPASGETDVLVFYTTDGGSTWYGFQAGDAMA
jgi:hypothetical protein